MQIAFILDDGNDKVTPIKIATALIEAMDNSKELPEDALRELVSYLAVHNRYNNAKN